MIPNTQFNDPRQYILFTIMDITYTDKFTYTHDNPYHTKLDDFSDFVLRDHDAEKHLGDWNKLVFKNNLPIKLEIGTGYGHFMTEFCKKYTDVNFIGMDYRFKRSFQLAKKLSQLPVKNFKYLRAKGERIHFIFNESEINTIFYFFPDPWPKNRHTKKRLFQPYFLENAYKVLEEGGEIYIKTDHDEYAKWMNLVINQSSQFSLKFYSEDLHQNHPEHFLAQNVTKFEHIFLKQGIKIKAFVLKSNKGIQ